MDPAGRYDKVFVLNDTPMTSFVINRIHSTFPPLQFCLFANKKNVA